MEKFVWDPAQYAHFAGHRARPFVDSTNAIELDAPQRVVDMGCGPGNMTLTMAHRWPNATITGYDASAEMIENTRTLITNHQGPDKNVSFHQQAPTTWTPPTETDAIITNPFL